MTLAWRAGVLLVALATPALAQSAESAAPTAPPAPPAREMAIATDDALSAYCLGANGELAERFRRMQLWGCGNAPAMAWCRDAKASAPEAMRHRERLVMRFTKTLTDKGLFDVAQPIELRRQLTAMVADGAKDANACFNDKGDKDNAACERLQRCAEAEKHLGL